MTESDALVLPAELRRRRPTTGRELVALLRDLLAHGGLPPKATRAIDLEAEMSGSDVTRLSLAASDVTLPSLRELRAADRAESRPARPDEPMPAGSLTRETSRVGEIILRARQVRWETASIDAEAHLEGGAFGWIVRGDERVAVEVLGDASGREPMRGSVRVETDLAPLVEAIRRTLDGEARREGVRVPKLRVQAWDLGSGMYRVYLDVRLRWKILPLSARVALVATLDDDLAVRCTDVHVSSANPLSAIGLLFARGQIRQAVTERPLLLRETFGRHLQHLAIRLDPRLHVEAVFASTE